MTRPDPPFPVPHPRGIVGEVDPVSDLQAVRADGVEQTLAAEWLSLSDLAPIEEAWADLAGRAAVPNVFYEPAFALAAAAVFGREVGAVVVWSSSGPRRRLMGLFPARIAARRYGLRPPVLVGWTHPYAPLGVPLVDRERPEAVLAAWLDFVAQSPVLPSLVLLPFVPQDGPFARALAAVLRSRNGQQACFGRHSRAVLTPSGAGPDALAHMLPAKKRKELRRQMRRLAAHGAPRWETTGAEGVEEALREYGRLEASGWKGRAGTAIRLDPALRGFVERAVGTLARAGQATVFQLIIGGQTVAAAIIVRSGNAAWFWKIAYDERAARASPGVQLALQITRTLGLDPALAQVDSCASADHPMINHLWRGRLEMADHLVAVGPRGARWFPAACGLEHARRFVENSVKRLMRTRGLTRVRATRGG